VGPPSDVYSLGLVLLECLTGHKAFNGSIVEVAAARLTTAPSIPADLGSEWAHLLTAMTRREPAERISMAEAASLLGALELSAPARDAPGEIPPVERTMVMPPVGNDVHLVGDPAVTSAMPSPFEPATFEPATSEPPTSEPTARTRPRAAVLVVVGTLLVAVVVGLVLTLGRPGVGSTPSGAVLDPPAVQGPLGAALTDLVESVQP
jgi:eukaryotic-like serine/threonine-protein kinase